MKTSGKLKENFKSEPYTLQSKDGSGVTVKSKHVIKYRRNTSLQFTRRSKGILQDVDPEAVRPAPVSGRLEESSVASRPKRTNTMPTKYKDSVFSCKWT